MSDNKESTNVELLTGELLVREGYIPVGAIKKVLDIQREQEFISAAARAYKPFGQICVELKLLTSEDLQRFLKKHQKSILLGELLIKMNYIKDKQLEKALQEQEKAPERRLGEILVSLNAINEEQLAKAISIQLDIPEMLPVIELIDVSLLQNLEPQFVVKNGFLPVSHSDDGVTVVMEDPLDEGLNRFLRQHFKCRVIQAIAPAKAIRAALKTYYTREFQRAKEAKAKQNAEPKTEQKELTGISMEIEDKQSALSEDYSSSSLSGINLYQEETPEEETSEEKKPEPEPEPQQLEETLVVGNVSLHSPDGKYKQEEGMLNYLIKNALLDQASAIHIEPQDKYLRVRYRINGVLHQKTALPQNLGMPMLARLKQVCSLNAETTKLPQRNRVQAKFNDQEFELSIATFPSIWGENMVLNLRQKQGMNPTELQRLEYIGFSPLNLKRLQKTLSQPGGLIIITGPARSGKTTTQYAAVNYLNLLTRSIVTAENPVENMITGINQGNWTPESGQSFTEMIRSMSFMDPDVLMVSELDSPETIEATIALALNGIKVISSYPSFDTMGALLRLAYDGLEAFLIASSNVSVLSQRLVRQLCPHCKQQEPASREFLDMLGLTAVEPDARQLYWPRGCLECNQTGYIGQSSIHEILVLNESIREAILAKKPAATIRDIARSEAKLVTMAEDGYAKSIVGITSLSEVQRVAFINEFDSKSPWEAEKIYSICKGEDKSYL